MSNPSFSPEMSTHQIWVGDNAELCLTDKLEDMDAATAGKAPSNHNHEGYSPTNHSHDYNDLSNKPTIPTEYTHPTTHPASMITGLSTVATSGSYTDLSDKPSIPDAYTHPANHPASMITGLATVATTGDYNDLSNKPTIPTVPSSLPANGGDADTVDGKHAADFAETTHTHSYNDLVYPPMLFGVEYRTNEMWNGEPLYTTLIDCGNFADGTNFDTNIACRYVVRHCGRIGWSSVPLIHYTLENAFTCWVEVSNYNGRIRVAMQGGSSVGSVPVHIQVWYTKSTN